MPRQPRPWFRFYSEAIESLKVHSLPDKLVKPWLFCLCLANTNSRRGRLPSISKVAFALRMSEAKANDTIQALVRHGMIEVERGEYVMHEWDEFQADRDVTSRLRHGSVTPTSRERHDRVEEEEEVDKEKEVEEEKEGEVEESARARDIFHLYDNYMGKPSVTATMRTLLLEAEQEYSDECIQHCFAEAAASSDGRHTWSYVKRILERHAREGCHGNGNGAYSGQPAAGAHTNGVAGGVPDMDRLSAFVARARRGSEQSSEGLRGLGAAVSGSLRHPGQA